MMMRRGPSQWGMAHLQGQGWRGDHNAVQLVGNARHHLHAALREVNDCGNLQHGGQQQVVVYSKTGLARVT